jgi:stage V sporulation protein AF
MRQNTQLESMGVAHMNIPNNIARIEQYLRDEVGLGNSFDVVYRPFEVGGRKAALFFYNGFAKDLILTPVLERLSYVTKEQLNPNLVNKLLRIYVPTIQIEMVQDMQELMLKVSSGASAIFLDRESFAFVMDTRMYPARSPEEPSNEKVVRGSRDGFIETLLTNVTLVRRRLRDPMLRFSVSQIGARTKVDVCVSYIHGLVNTKLLDHIQCSLQQMSKKDLPLTDKQLEEELSRSGWSIYPTVRYSERPDVICSHLLEGHIVIFVDTSPSVMIIPATFFHHLQHAEEYRNTAAVGTYLRWVRYLGLIVSLCLLPLWLLFALQPELLPDSLEFIGPRDEGSLPLFVQFLIAELGIDLMRMAAIHTPTPLATAMGLVAAILIGEIAVKVGLFVPEVILYVAISAIGSFATPSYELSLANRMVRLILISAVALFHVPGFMVGSTVLFILAVRKRSFGTPFLWPFIPFQWKNLKQLLVRKPFA